MLTTLVKEKKWKVRKFIWNKITFPETCINNGKSVVLSMDYHSVSKITFVVSVFYKI